MQFKINILNFMFDKSSIPIWVVDSNNVLEYSSLPMDKCAKVDMLTKFLAYFKSDSTIFPQIKRLNPYEMYLHFIIPNSNKLVVAGPAFSIHPLSGTRHIPLSANYLLNTQQLHNMLLFMPSTPVAQFCTFSAALAQVFLDKEFSCTQLESNIGDYSLKNILDEQLIEIIFDIREDERMSVYAPEIEDEVLSCVRRGDVTAIKQFKYPVVRDPNARGTQKQYLFEIVAMVTLATRAAVEGGLDSVDAFSLSDLYLKQLSQSKSDAETSSIASHVFSHFAERVNKANENYVSDKTYSPYVSRAIQYIRTHLHYDLSLDEVARELNINAKYLSRLFVVCRGEKFSSYVQRERIAEAKSLLVSSERSIVDISNSLSFSSQSYFIKVFVRYAGMTPGQFLDKRKRHF